MSATEFFYSFKFNLEKGQVEELGQIVTTFCGERIECFERSFAA